MGRRFGWLVAAALALSCKNPFLPRIEEGAVYVDPTDPTIVVQNLRTAYISKDLEGYRRCLDPDSFRFYFDQGEEGLQQLLEEEWGLDSLVWGFDEEMLSAEILFDETDFISLDFSNGVQLTATANTEEWLYSYLLTVDPPPDSSDYAEGRGRLTFKKRANGWWYIVRWEDYKL